MFDKMVDLRALQIKTELLGNRYFSLARQDMFLSYHQVRVGAVMVVGSKQYIVADNYLFKTHPLIEKHYPNFVQSIHAELNALLKYNEVRLGKLPKRTSMYVYREDRHGIVKLAKPCKTCEKLMKKAGIKRVFYSTETGFKIKRL